MNTEAKAFSQFALAFRDQKGLQKETYQEMLSKHSQVDEGLSWGLGFKIEETEDGQAYGHSGSTSPGFMSNFKFYPDLDMGYIIFTNSTSGYWMAIELLEDFLLLEK